MHCLTIFSLCILSLHYLNSLSFLQLTQLNKSFSLAEARADLLEKQALEAGIKLNQQERKIQEMAQLIEELKREREDAYKKAVQSESQYTELKLYAEELKEEVRYLKDTQVG